jgi:hypothetical protein
MSAVLKGGLMTIASTMWLGWRRRLDEFDINYRRLINDTAMSNSPEKPQGGMKSRDLIIGIVVGLITNALYDIGKAVLIGGLPSLPLNLEFQAHGYAFVARWGICRRRIYGGHY